MSNKEQDAYIKELEKEVRELKSILKVANAALNLEVKNENILFKN